MTMDVAFCIDAADRALQSGARPEIFNTDQGAQFTCREFTGRLRLTNIRISMDGRGRALDNVFVERLRRTVKYEAVYLKVYASPGEARQSLRKYFSFYNYNYENYERLHQALSYQTPAAVYGLVRGPR